MGTVPFFGSHNAFQGVTVPAREPSYGHPIFAKFAVISDSYFNAAWAAASRAIGTRKGEQDT